VDGRFAVTAQHFTREWRRTMLTRRQNLLASTFFVGGTLGLGYAVTGDSPKAVANCANDCTLDWMSGRYYQCSNAVMWPGYLCTQSSQENELCYINTSALCNTSGGNSSSSGSGGGY
jgi:hypothetical protein